MTFFASLRFVFHRFRCNVLVGCKTCEDDRPTFIAIAIDMLIIAVSVFMYFSVPILGGNASVQKFEPKNNEVELSRVERQLEAITWESSDEFPPACE